MTGFVLQDYICGDFDVTDNSRCTLSQEEVILWIIDSYFLMDLFHLLSSPDVN